MITDRFLIFPFTNNVFDRSDGLSGTTLILFKNSSARAFSLTPAIVFKIDLKSSSAVRQQYKSFPKNNLEAVIFA